LSNPPAEKVEKLLATFFMPLFDQESAIKILANAPDWDGGVKTLGDDRSEN
jgi:hypothetical protein